MAQYRYGRRFGARGGAHLALFVLIAGSSPTRGNPPVAPLPAPTFSLDLLSPKVERGEVRGDALLEPDPPVLQLQVEGWEMGLGLFEDDIDALSAGNANMGTDTVFVLLFSVDVETIGVADPAPELTAIDLPYNVLDQAQRGHAAGDEFMSTSLFTIDQSVTLVLWNNLLVRNNFDEGGSDFVAEPETSAATIVVDQPQDNVDAIAVLSSNTAAVYFSVTKDSPSLAGIQGGPSPSGADIFLYSPPPARSMPKAREEERSVADPMREGQVSCQVSCCEMANDLYVDCRGSGGSVGDCAAQAHDLQRACLIDVCGLTPGPPPGCYASAVDLGLRQGDDIDGLVVFDLNADGIFNGPDRVLFSLAGSSPSLATIPGASAAGAAADVFLATPGVAQPVLFAAAATLGLGSAQDNIDALDVEPCSDFLTCASLHGIRTDTPIPTVSAWGMVVLVLLVLVGGTILGRRLGEYRLA